MRASEIVTILIERIKHGTQSCLVSRIPGHSAIHEPAWSRRVTAAYTAMGDCNAIRIGCVEPFKLI